jgi:hypothetical protein
VWGRSGHGAEQGGRAEGRTGGRTGGMTGGRTGGRAGGIIAVQYKIKRASTGSDPFPPSLGGNPTQSIEIHVT